jgi:hypothetical protein
MQTEEQKKLSAFADKLAPLVTRIGQVNGLTIDSETVHQTILEQNESAYPIVARHGGAKSRVYLYIIYASAEDKLPIHPDDLGELDITLKLCAPKSL